MKKLFCIPFILGAVAVADVAFADQTPISEEEYDAKKMAYDAANHASGPTYVINHQNKAIDATSGGISLCVNPNVRQNIIDSIWIASDIWNNILGWRKITIKKCDIAPIYVHPSHLMEFAKALTPAIYLSSDETDFLGKTSYVSVSNDSPYTGTSYVDPNNAAIMMRWKWPVGSYYEHWKFACEPAPNNRTWYDFTNVMMHEMGHLLGLGHDSNPDSIMYQYMPSNKTLPITASDREGARAANLTKTP